MTAEGRPRPLGFLSLLALGVNGVIGVGIFFAPASVAAQLPGQAGTLVYLATAVVLLPIAFGYAALGRRFDVDGGPYVWAEAAFGPRVAFGIGWVSYVSSLFSVAAVVSGLSHHLAPLAGIESEIGVRAAAVLCVLLLGGIASTGLRPSARIWSVVTVMKLVPLFALLALATFRYGDVPPSASPLPGHASFHGVERAILVVVFATQGFEIVPVLAGSVRESARAVPWATVFALVFASILYTALHAVTVHAVPDLGKSATPLVSAASRYGGSAASALVSAGASVSALGIAFGMMNTTPRYLSALSGPHALGGWIGRIDVRFVPQRALWITVVGAALLLALSRTITELFVLSSLAVLLQYLVVLASLAVLAHRRAHGLVPRSLWPVPLSVLGVVLAAQGAEAREITVAVGVILIGEVLRQVRLRAVV